MTKADYSRLLGRVGARAEAVLEIAVETLLAAAPVNKLMQFRSAIVLLAGEAARIGECDEVLGGDEACSVSSMADVSASRRGERFNCACGRRFRGTNSPLDNATSR